MAWDDRRRRDAEDPWPPPRPPEPPAFPDDLWGGDDDWHDDFWNDAPWEDARLKIPPEAEGNVEYDFGGCDCGGPPPPIFHLPPPPPLPRFPEEEEEGSGCDAPPPSEVCPALLVAGDAHTHQRLQPPLAALVVAAATLTLVFIIAALVCWR